MPEANAYRQSISFGGTRMNIHKYARLTPHGRAILVRRILEEGLRVAEAAHASGVSERTAYKWLARYRAEGPEGLWDRSSRPHRCPHRTSDARRARVVALRRDRRTYRDISHTLGVAPSTVGRIAQRAGVNRLSQLEPPPPPNRYVFPNPGDLLHLDTKKLGRFVRPGHRVTGDRRQGSRGAGWEFVHVALDDTSRTSFSSIHPNENADSACRALLAALRYFDTLGISFRRVMTDNGSCYVSRRFARLCRRPSRSRRRRSCPVNVCCWASASAGWIPNSAPLVSTATPAGAWPTRPLLSSVTASRTMRSPPMANRSCSAHGRPVRRSMSVALRRTL